MYSNSKIIRRFAVLALLVGLGVCFHSYQLGEAWANSSFDSQKHEGSGSKSALEAKGLEADRKGELYAQGGPGCGNEGMKHGGKRCTQGEGRHGGGKHGMRHQGDSNSSTSCQARTTAKAPASIYNKTNPLKDSAEIVEKGKALYQSKAQPSCTMCHGVNGDGLGNLGQGMKPAPRNFTCPKIMGSLPDGQLFWIIKKGSKNTGMPPFKNLSDDEIWQLVHYIRQFSK